MAKHATTLEGLALGLVETARSFNVHATMPTEPPTPDAVAAAWIDANPPIAPEPDAPEGLAVYTPKLPRYHYPAILVRNAWNVASARRSLPLWQRAESGAGYILATTIDALIERRPDFLTLDHLAAYRAALALEIEVFLDLFAAYDPPPELANDVGLAPMIQLGELVKPWAIRPRKVHPNLRPDRILPAKLGMVDSGGPRASRLLSLFSPAAHRSGQLALPGFGLLNAPDAPALPLALYQIGNEHPSRGGGRGAPLALRLFIEAVLAVDLQDRGDGQPVALDLTLRELLARLYPGPRPHPARYWPRLMAAAEALDNTRIPWHNPDTGNGGLRRVVSMGDIPRGPDALDDLVSFTVRLPPGSGPGPVVPPSLGAWGTRSAPAYYALLNLAYRWWQPGVTRHPTGRGSHWLQAMDPARYEPVNDWPAITHPLSSCTRHRDTVRHSLATLRMLEAEGLVTLREAERRILPGPAWPGMSPQEPT